MVDLLINPPASIVLCKLLVHMWCQLTAGWPIVQLADLKFAQRMVIPGQSSFSSMMNETQVIDGSRSFQVNRLAC